MTYLSIKFHIPSPRGTLIIAIEPTARKIFRLVTILLFYFLQNITLTKLSPYITQCIRTLHHGHSHLTGSRLLHVVITDCRTLIRHWSRF